MNTNATRSATPAAAARSFTLPDAQEIVRNAGHRIGTAYADEMGIYACSLKSVPGTYGHPAFEVVFNNDTRWLTVTGRPAVKFG